MRLQVLNRGTAEVITVKVPHLFISIYSTDSTPANIKPNEFTLAILPIHFDDVEKDEVMYGTKVFPAITEAQATKIWEFVDLAMIAEVELIIVHCDAGTCRSPAVAAAIDLVINGDDTKWFQPPYLPNKKVYKTMLKVKGLSNDYSN